MIPSPFPLTLVLGLATAASTTPPAIEQHAAANGLTVLVVENHTAPVITIEIGVKNGSMTEPLDYNGISHLYEHMFFKANAAIPDQTAWHNRAREFGMRWNGTTAIERVNYYVTTTSDHLADAMVFMHDAIVTPKFDPAELAKEKVVVTGELDRRESTPSYFLNRAVQQKVFWKYPSRKVSLGNRKTVLTATVKKLETIRRRYYVPNNSVLVVTGDVTAADVFAQVDTLYADWKRAPDPFVKYPLVKHPPIKKTEVVVVEQDVHTVSGRLVWQGPSTVGASADDAYAADVLSMVTAASTSRFQRALVESGACVTARLSWYTQRNVGPITLAFEATPDQVDACVAAIHAELGKLTSADYATDDELHRAARRLELATVRGRELSSDYAHTLTFWWTSASIDDYLGYVDQVFAVEHADLVRMIDTWITGKPYVLGVMVSPEMAAKGLDAAHFTALIPATGAP